MLSRRWTSRNREIRLRLLFRISICLISSQNVCIMWVSGSESSISRDAVLNSLDASFYQYYSQGLSLSLVWIMLHGINWGFNQLAYYIYAWHHTKIPWNYIFCDEICQSIINILSQKSDWLVSIEEIELLRQARWQWEWKNTFWLCMIMYKWWSKWITGFIYTLISIPSHRDFIWANQIQPIFEIS